MKNLMLALSIIALSACSVTKSVSELPPTPSGEVLHGAIKKIASTCRRFSKNGHATEQEIFDDCMYKASPVIGKTNETITGE